MSGISLLLSDSRGQYIPRDFCTGFFKWENIKDEDWEICKEGPDNDLYYDAWDSILSNATYTDQDGHVWHLSQDGDLFAYCEELMTSEEYKGFFGVDREMFGEKNNFTSSV